MAGELKTYAFADVIVIVGGKIIGGFAEGDDAIEVEPSSDAWKKSVGNDGEVSRAQMSDKSGEIRLKLQQTSSSCAVLDGFITADRLSKAGVVACMVKNSSGRDLHTGEQCWIRKAPKAGYGGEVKERAYILDVAELETHSLGN